ncbi:MAG: hypothetical protein QOF33_1673 [Thermomicrobiales bacterium]|nr:hypothetical protein [Thermomicrobiales bacterium]
MFPASFRVGMRTERAMASGAPADGTRSIAGSAPCAIDLAMAEPSSKDRSDAPPACLVAGSSNLGDMARSPGHQTNSLDRAGESAVKRRAGACRPRRVSRWVRGGRGLIVRALTPPAVAGCYVFEVVIPECPMEASDPACPMSLPVWGVDSRPTKHERPRSTPCSQSPQCPAWRSHFPSRCILRSGTAESRAIPQRSQPVRTIESWPFVNIEAAVFVLLNLENALVPR